jgi:DNA-binding NtrC family response regulator
MRHELEVKMATTVLLVDDHPDVLEVTACMLEDAGYDVICASGPQQAQELASQRNIDVVVSDLNLSQGVSGVEMGLAMRRSGLDCPMLLVSGGARPERAVMQDWMSYLAKPFDRQSLLQKLDELACGN